MALPKAASLTDALTLGASSMVSPDEFAEVRQAFEHELRRTTRSLPTGERIRVDGYSLRNAMSGGAGHGGAFRWTPWTARRPIGIECVRASLANPRLTPLQASHDVITRLVRQADEQRGRPGSLSEWLAGLAVGGRTVVQAEAVVWATQLTTALDWTRLSRPIVGDDRSVVLPSSSQVLLRGRIELRTFATPARVQGTNPRRRLESEPSVLFATMTGRPSPTARTELGLAALTVALGDRHGEVPVRVLGWWPQCGRALVVPVDLTLLNQTCEAVVGTVRSMCPTIPQKSRPSRATGERTGRHTGKTSLPQAVGEVDRIAS
jgi:hypothetical protein